MVPSPLRAEVKYRFLSTEAGFHLGKCQVACVCSGYIVQQLHVRVSYKILSWKGRKQDCSRMIVACVATRGVWGHIPPSLGKFRSSQIASGTNFPSNTY